MSARRSMLMTLFSSACCSPSTLVASSHGCSRLPSTPSLSARHSTSTLEASSCGCGHLSPTLPTSTHRSTSPLVASSCGSGRFLSTPSTSARRSTSTPLAPFAEGGYCSASTHVVACARVFGCSSSTLHAASTCAGDRSYSIDDAPAVSLTAHEIAQLWCLLDA
jgi:hypothetical protein